MKKKNVENNIVHFPQERRVDSMQSLSIMNMAKRIEELKTNNQKISEQAAKAILKALDTKDHYTFGHSMRVCYFSMVMGKELGLSDPDIYELQLSALFHDIGKIGTPDALLNKPTRLNDEEFSIMKQHPAQSFEILKEFSGFDNVARAALHHHERYDGRGYPSALKGEQIPLYSRIILIADTFDAMTSTRVYRKGLDYKIAFNELIEFSGSQFDPGLVKHFIKGMKKEDLKKEEQFYIPLMDQKFNKNAA